MSSRYVASYLPPPSGGGTAAPIGMAVESDAALALGAAAILLLAPAAEADIAVARPPMQLGAVALAVEADQAYGLLALHALAIGIAVEGDTAFSLSTAAAAGPGLADESDIAFVLQAVQIRSVAIAVEADVAVALGAGGAGGAAPGAADVWGYVLPGGLTAGALLAELQRLVVDVHAVHGLDPAAPLTVTPTRRAAGGVEQGIAAAADGTVTVARQ